MSSLKNNSVFDNNSLKSDTQIERELPNYYTSKMLAMTNVSRKWDKWRLWRDIAVTLSCLAFCDFQEVDLSSL